MVDEYDFRPTDPMYKCRTCGHGGLIYDVQTHKNWCPLCDSFSDLHGNERRKLTTGVVKDTRTGFVTEQPSRKLDRFDKFLGSNKDAD